ncbi:hypothetical protein [Microcoleus sp. MON2_D5]|uniref:hypothetical protein n=1 Tax=Microcoleus sp. MON2_D5 TaxID=2818833 RepID=UPI002FCE95B6
MTPTTDIVQKLWNLCHVVRDNESLRYQTSPCILSRSQKCAKFVTLRSFETGANCLASVSKATLLGLLWLPRRLMHRCLEIALHF